MNISLSLKILALVAFVAASTVSIVQTAPVASSAMAMAHSSATLGI
ncbi:hypothetical protein [Duganella violaceipulchra]|uniref:Uncharacterized protein n=1 Tax=Duganella violaceipulchra TaxID=2849652 RepID=A0AA41LAG7_9BURK|nr:hypothetical protein [Duganella violaceicalia]MBV6324250.1 hypothetical protein [Duganella violaceicalia]MCP2007362.1 hypothetical protein [Duganella violaceicalia]